MTTERDKTMAKRVHDILIHNANDRVERADKIYYGLLRQIEEANQDRKHAYDLLARLCNDATKEG